MSSIDAKEWTKEAGNRLLQETKISACGCIILLQQVLISFTVLRTMSKLRTVNAARISGGSTDCVQWHPVQVQYRYVVTNKAHKVYLATILLTQRTIVAR